MQPSEKSKSKGPIAAVVAVLIVAAIGIGAFTLLGGKTVTQEDIDSSIAAAKLVEERNDEELGSDIDSSTDFQTILDAQQKQFDEWKTAHEELTDSNGINHEEVKDEYQEYIKQYDSIIKYEQDIEPISKFMAEGNKCFEDESSFTDNDKLGTCVEQLRAIEPEFSEDFRPIVQSLTDFMEKIQDFNTDSEKAIADEDFEAITKLTSDLETDLKGFEENIEDIENALGTEEYEDAIKDLIEALEKVEL